MFYAALALNVHEKGMRVATHIEKKGIWFVKSTRDPSFTVALGPTQLDYSLMIGNSFPISHRIGFYISVPLDFPVGFAGFDSTNLPKLKCS